MPLIIVLQKIKKPRPALKHWPGPTETGFRLIPALAPES
jgi:hypothetical protein